MQLSNGTYYRQHMWGSLAIRSCSVDDFFRPGLQCYLPSDRGYMKVVSSNNVLVLSQHKTYSTVETWVWWEMPAKLRRHIFSGWHWMRMQCENTAVYIDTHIRSIQVRSESTSPEFSDLVPPLRVLNTLCKWLKMTKITHRPPSRKLPRRNILVNDSDKTSNDDTTSTRTWHIQ